MGSCSRGRRRQSSLLTKRACSPDSNALCDESEAELKPIFAFFSTFSWTIEDQINQTLQRNLNLVKAARGQNPSITTVTYAAEGTVQHTTTSGRTARNRNLLTAVLCMIAGLVIGLLLGMFMSWCRRKNRTQTESGELDR
ncbi:hypothetical protein LLF88_02070 [bacterium]|nr:hypothetical protein [bacterium]